MPGDAPIGGDGGVPVRHDDPVKAPFLAGQHGAQVAAVGGVDSVDPVVGGHDGGGSGRFHRDLKTPQVDLPEGPLADPDVHPHPVVLLVVAGEVLHGHPAPAAVLDARVTAAANTPDRRGSSA